MDKFRFNDQTQEIHKYCESRDAYLLLGTYIAFWLDTDMSDDQKTLQVKYDLGMRRLAKIRAE